MRFLRYRVSSSSSSSGDRSKHREISRRRNGRLLGFGPDSGKNAWRVSRSGGRGSSSMLSARCHFLGLSVYISVFEGLTRAAVEKFYQRGEEEGMQRTSFFIKNELAWGKLLHATKGV